MNPKLIDLLNRIQSEANNDNISTVIGLVEEAKELANNIHFRLKGLHTGEQFQKEGILALIN